MTSWTSPITWTSSDGTAAQFNQQLRDDLMNLDERLVLHGLLSATRRAAMKGALMGVRCTASANQSITNNADTTITWDTEEYDTDAFHSTSSNTERITIPSGGDGYYLVTLTTMWVTAPHIYQEELWVEDDAGLIIGRRIVQSTDLQQGSTLTFVTPAMTAGEWMRARVHQDSGSTATLDKDAEGCGFSAWRIAST